VKGKRHNAGRSSRESSVHESDCVATSLKKLGADSVLQRGGFLPISYRAAKSEHERTPALAFSVSLWWYAGTCRDPIAHCEQKVAVGEFVQRIKTPCGEERVDFRLKDSIVVGNSRSARERWFGAASYRWGSASRISARLRRCRPLPKSRAPRCNPSSMGMLKRGTPAPGSSSIRDKS